MSKRIEHKSAINDRAVAIAAFDNAGYRYHEHGDTIAITSGPFANVSIDLKTGTISSDSDFGHTKELLGTLQRVYNEAMIRRDLNTPGVYIGQRVENYQGQKGVIAFVGCRAQG